MAREVSDDTLACYFLRAPGNECRDRLQGDSSAASNHVPRSLRRKDTPEIYARTSMFGSSAETSPSMSVTSKTVVPRGWRSISVSDL